MSAYVCVAVNSCLSKSKRLRITVFVDPVYTDVAIGTSELALGLGTWKRQ